jgi:hypothetical protein
MYGDVLFSFHRPVLSLFGMDMTTWDLPWRGPAFEELAHGHLMLRNPYTFSGMPFFSESQVAILYPINWMHLLLPPDRAVNVIIALHTFLVGFFTYLWGRYRALSKLGALLSAVIMMFGGPFFLHLLAGHVTHMAAMVWAPLLFLAFDLILDGRYANGVLLGSFSLAMQVLAGHPQYVYFTAIALCLYGLLRLVRHGQPGKVVAAFLGVGTVALILTAVQTLSIAQSASESIRAGTGGVSFQVAGTFSFPPANFLTLLAPQCFGNAIDVPYWGEWYLWECSLFMSLSGLVLALWAVVQSWKRVRLSLVMALVLLLLALGSYSPLFPLLYRYLPGLNRFRGDSKFIFQAMLFLSLVSGIGFDTLAEQTKRRGTAAGLALGGAILLGGAGIVISMVAEDGPGGIWSRLMQRIGGAHLYTSPAVYQTALGVAQTGAYTATSFCISALTLGLVAAILWTSRSGANAASLLAGLAAVELFVNARLERPTYPYGTSLAEGVQDFLGQHPGDYRYYEPREPNDAVTFRNYTVWGYDSNISKRYAEFVALTQGLNPGDFDVLMWPAFTRFHPLCALLRWRYSFLPAPDGQTQIIEAKAHLPHVFLAQDCRVLAGRDRVFAALKDSAFDPAKMVILESSPLPVPAPGPVQGTAHVLGQTTDALTVEANLLRPALLVITDSYSRFFSAKPLTGSSQGHYDVLPADWTLMAIPLAAGNHRLVLSYATTGYLTGRWISLVGWAIYFGALGTMVARRLRPKPRATATSSSEPTAVAAQAQTPS